MRKLQALREQIFNTMYCDGEGYSVTKDLGSFLPIDTSNAVNDSFFNVGTGYSCISGAIFYNPRVYVHTHTGGTSGTVSISARWRKINSFGLYVGAQKYGVLSTREKKQYVNRVIDVCRGQTSVNINMHCSFVAGQTYLEYKYGGQVRTTDGNLNGVGIASKTVNADTGQITVNFSSPLDNDFYPVSLSYTVNSDYEVAFEEEIALGDNTTRNFRAILDKAPIAPNSVYVVTTVEGETVVGRDNGSGSISSLLPSPFTFTGSINYTTGYIELTFPPGYEPDADVDVTVYYSYALIRRGLIAQTTNSTTIDYLFSTSVAANTKILFLGSKDGEPEDALLPPDVFTYRCFINVNGGRIGVRSSRSWADDGSEDYYDEYFTIRCKPKKWQTVTFLAKTNTGTADIFLRAYTGESDNQRVNIAQLLQQDSVSQLVTDPQNASYNCVKATIGTELTQVVISVMCTDSNAKCLELSFIGSEAGHFTQVLYITALQVYTGECLHAYAQQPMSYYAFNPRKVGRDFEGFAYKGFADGSVDLQQVVAARSGTTVLNNSNSPVQRLICEEQGSSTASAPNFQLRGATHILAYTYAGNTGTTRGWITNLDYRRFNHAWACKRVTGTVGTNGTAPNWTDETTNPEQPYRRLHIPDATQSGVTAGTLPYTWWRYKEDELSIVQFNTGTSGSQPNWQYNSSNRHITLHVPSSNGGATWTALSNTDYQRGYRITTYSVTVGSGGTSPHFSVNWNHNVHLNIPYASSNAIGFIRSSDYNYIYEELNPVKTYNVYNTNSTRYTSEFWNVPDFNHNSSQFWFAYGASLGAGLVNGSELQSALNFLQTERNRLNNLVTNLTVRRSNLVTLRNSILNHTYCIWQSKCSPIPCHSEEGCCSVSTPSCPPGSIFLNGCSDYEGSALGCKMVRWAKCCSGYCTYSYF